MFVLYNKVTFSETHMRDENRSIERKLLRSIVFDKDTASALSLIDPADNKSIQTIQRYLNEDLRILEDNGHFPPAVALLKQLTDSNGAQTVALSLLDPNVQANQLTR